MKKLIITIAFISVAVFTACTNSSKQDSGFIQKEHVEAIDSSKIWKTTTVESRLLTVSYWGKGSTGLLYLKLSDKTILQFYAPFTDNQLIVAFAEKGDTITYRTNNQARCGYEFK